MRTSTNPRQHLCNSQTPTYDRWWAHGRTSRNSECVREQSCGFAWSNGVRKREISTWTPICIWLCLRLGVNTRTGVWEYDPILTWRDSARIQFDSLRLWSNRSRQDLHHVGNRVEPRSDGPHFWSPLQFRQRLGSWQVVPDQTIVSRNLQWTHPWPPRRPRWETTWTVRRLETRSNNSRDHRSDSD